MGKVARQWNHDEKGEPKRIEPRSFRLPAWRLTARQHQLTPCQPPPLLKLPSRACQTALSCDTSFPTWVAHYLQLNRTKTSTLWLQPQLLVFNNHKLSLLKSLICTKAPDIIKQKICTNYITHNIKKLKKALTLRLTDETSNLTKFSHPSGAAHNSYLNSWSSGTLCPVWSQRRTPYCPVSHTLS